MSKRRSQYVNIEVPIGVLHALEEIAETTGRTAEEELMAIVAEAHRTAEKPKAVKKKGHMPNVETARVIREAREGKNVTRYKTPKEMYDDLNG